MRTHIQVISAVALVLVAGWVTYFLVFDRGRPLVVQVEAVSGEVDRSGGPGGMTPAQAGDILLQRERLVVGQGGSALLGLGEDTQLRLDPGSVIEVVEVDRAGVRIELEDGRIEARVRPSGPALAIGAAGRTLRAQDADFTVGVDEDAVVVEVGQGAVSLEDPARPEGARSLIAGQRASATAGDLPFVEAADADLLLDVAWPGGERDARAASLTLTGRSAPGARIQVTGGSEPRSGRADGAGDFRITLPLSQGENELLVEAFDALGRRVSVQGQVARDSEAPAARAVQISWEN